MAGTVDFDHIVRHYHYSHETINPHRIVPINPVIDWTEPHGRERLKAALSRALRDRAALLLCRKFVNRQGISR